MSPIRIALIGLGKIARDQHLPALRASDDFALSATLDPQGAALPAVPHFADIAALAGSGVAIDAVAICTPPQARRAIALAAIACGWHVLLEKPPASSVAEVIAMREAAAARGVTLFASWHSRFAAGVERARGWLSGRRIERARIVWREDVRVWHPGQQWLWEPGGLGVFDPGINALSIATHILPHPLFVERAELLIPANLAAPIAARVALCDTAGSEVTMDLDFRETGPQIWTIAIDTPEGTVTLANGGEELTLPGDALAHPALGADSEYPALYAHFASLIRAGRDDVDTAPLQLVADAFLRGVYRATDRFE